MIAPHHGHAALLQHFTSAQLAGRPGCTQDQIGLPAFQTGGGIGIAQPGLEFQIQRRQLGRQFLIQRMRYHLRRIVRHENANALRRCGLQWRVLRRAGCLR